MFHKTTIVIQFIYCLINKFICLFEPNSFKFKRKIIHSLITNKICTHNIPNSIPRGDYREKRLFVGGIRWKVRDRLSDKWQDSKLPVEQKQILTAGFWPPYSMARHREPLCFAHFPASGPLLPIPSLPHLPESSIVCLTVIKLSSTFSSQQKEKITGTRFGLS